MIREVILPKLGQTMDEGTIVEWLKQEGDPIQRGEVLFTTESDKATLEVEAPTKGFLRKILVPAGQTIPVLTVVALITRTADEDLAGYESQVAGAGSQVRETPAIASSQPETVSETRFFGKNLVSQRVFASPRARRFAREKGVDLSLVTGTGPGGRIVERDVVTYLESLPKATPVARRLAEQAGLDLRTVPGGGPGGRITKEDVAQALAEPQVAEVAQPETLKPETLKPLAGVRAVVARRMHESHQATAPVTLTADADVTAFVALRERLKTSLADELGFNLGYNDLLIKVAARALREFPYMNARLEYDTPAPGEGAGQGWEAGAIRYLQDVHVALAVDTERGLLVPVVRDADRKGLVEIARELRDLVARAREGKALPDELSGSTFTITNLGMHEIDAFTPIINLPETAILGVGRIKARPTVVDGEICVRQMMWLSLTFDHRLVDGAPAARFLQRIKQLVEEPYLLLV
jgi:pyruvate dehydrogenase E2 component (dihydrolipoamide acetyltransferase)